MLFLWILGFIFIQMYVSLKDSCGLTSEFTFQTPFCFCLNDLRYHAVMKIDLLIYFFLFTFDAAFTGVFFVQCPSPPFPM